MALPVTLKVGAFAVVVMATYSYYANSIPQIESKPPEELSLEGGSVTPQQLMAAGEKIFYDKGGCTVCHGIGQRGRGPDLSGVGARAATRKPGMPAKGYLLESLISPGAYVVEGFPNIMQPMNRPPVSLNRSELWAVIAFLESQGGTVDVKLEDIPASVAAPAGAGQAAPAFEIPGDPKAGQAVFTGKGLCFTCHKAGAVGVGQIGPDLSSIARIQTPEYLMGKILNPASKGTVAGFPAGVMPPTFGQMLTAREFTDLIAFLMTLKGQGGQAAAAPGAPAAKPAGQP
ncbi:MAG: c-type cytochrome [Candidatus Rokubacteria bacterium]|nr:c-type cytochrome [Candidatus Rokubacteria bacterium]